MACKYIIKDENGNEQTFDTKAALVDYIKKNNLAEKNVRVGKPAFTTSSLANVLRQMSFGENNYSPSELREFQEELLNEFIKMEDQSQFFYKMGSIVALTKGPGKNFDNIDNIKKNLADLGVEEYGGEFNEDIPFDVRYLITGDNKYKPQNADAYTHKITSNNVRIIREIDILSKTMFMERTPSFVAVVDKTIANLKPSVAVVSEKVKEIKDELSAFAQIAAYKKWVEINDKKTSTLRNSLIYDSEGNIPNIVDIVRQVMEIAPGNSFLQFVLPVSTTVKVSKKKQRNIINRDLINTIEGKTRGRLEPNLVASLMDSFAELYQNPKTQFHAKALFDYLIVKDGLMFKNKSFIKMVPTLMFREMSDATGMATKLLAANSAEEYKRILRELAALEIVDREGNYVDYFTDKEKQSFNDAFRANDLMKAKNMLYNKVFGMDYNNLYNSFERIYATDVRFQYNLDLARTKIVNSKGVTKSPDGLTFHKDEKNIYMHVALFTDKLRSLEKGSDARKAYFVESLDDIGRAGFSVAEKDEDNDEGKIYLNFKKFMRVREADKNYYLYQLVAVDRDGKRYQGAGMTADGELIPRGVYAVYQRVQPVGTANSTGVADLGPRPSKEQVMQTIADKLKKDDDGKNPPPPDNTTPPTTPTPVAPQPPTGQGGAGTTITGGIFGGLQQLPSSGDEDISGMPLDFFTNEQVDKNPC